MNHDEWLEALLDAWDELSGMNMYFENVNFAEDPDGDTITANEALAYASTVAAEIEDLPHVLNEIQEKIETLRQIAKQEP